MATLGPAVWLTTTSASPALPITCIGAVFAPRPYPIPLVRATITTTIPAVMPAMMGSIVATLASGGTGHDDRGACLLFTAQCPPDDPCSSLGAPCISCVLNASCTYGALTNASCSVNSGVSCTGSRNFTRPFNCRYCYQTSAETDYVCAGRANCNTRSITAVSTTLCTVNDNVICLGMRGTVAATTSYAPPFPTSTIAA